jgi:rubrerythrin
MQSLEDVLDMAIEKEELAASTYRDMAERAERDDLRTLLIGLARVEEVHRQSLEEVRMGDLSLFARPWPEQQELSAPSTPVDVTPDASPTRAILAAIEAERHAFQLYTRLAQLTDDAGLRTVLEALARDEAGHWHTLEQAYDQLVAGGD